MIKDLKPGDVLGGRYKVISLLGKGAMGKVYRVLDLKLHEDVALKIVATDLMNNETMQRFIQEIKLARNVTHENVCRIYHFEELDGVQFISMQFIEGTDLGTILKKEGGLKLNRALPILKDILKGLIAIHSKGIVHRDIKPANILIDKNGKAFINDFGIAKGIVGKGLTRTGVTFGTPDYISPEQAKGEKVDERSDIYSLGVMMYKIFSGKLPFDADSDIALVIKHITEEPEPIEKAAPDLPEPLRQLVKRCMAKNPAERPASAKEILEELEQASIEEKRLSPAADTIEKGKTAVIKETLKSGKSEVSEHISTADTQYDTKMASRKRKKHSFLRKRSFQIVIIVLVTIIVAVLSISLYKKKKHYEDMVKINSQNYEGMVQIPAGSFKMGDHFEEGKKDELPIHTVYISKFWMDKYEVTVEDYKKCVDAGACRKPDSWYKYYDEIGYDKLPMSDVSWDDACEYCEWMAKRLPTEAEWEYAARGGLSGARYPNGDSLNCREANWGVFADGMIGGCSNYRFVDAEDAARNGGPIAVGSYTANGYGLYDMAGNVWEWTNDWYDENYYKNSPTRNPKGPSDGTWRVLRGGSIASTGPTNEDYRFMLSFGSRSIDDQDLNLMRVSYRGAGEPTGTSNLWFGFRCAR